MPAKSGIDEDGNGRHGQAKQDAPMEARAVRKHIRSSPRKMRTVINVVRGKSVPDALSTLNFLPQQVTDTVKTTIMSAVHNLMDRNPDERFDEAHHDDAKPPEPLSPAAQFRTDRCY